MTRSFIITLDLPITNPDSDAGVAEDLKELVGQDYDVITCHPWQTQAASAPELAPPTPQLPV